MSDKITTIENTDMHKEPVQQEAAQAESVCPAGEEKKRRFTRSRLLALLAMLCLLATLSAGTMAYFRVENTAWNVITTGGIEMKLIERRAAADGETDFPEEGVDDMAPGAAQSKIVAVENTGNDRNGTANSIYARIRITKAIQPAEGVKEKLDPENVVLDIDNMNWTEKDGYYYFTGMLEEDLNPGELPPGAKTPPLFNTATLKASVGNEYKNSVITVKVRAEGVQAKNNGDSALTAIGWPD